MQKKVTWGVVTALILIVLYFYWTQLRGAGPAILPPSDDIADVIPPSEPIAPGLPSNGDNIPPEGGSTPPPKSNGTPPPSSPPTTPPVNKTDFPLILPPGFEISIFAKNVPSARTIAFDSNGNMWVSQHRRGTITKFDIENGVVKSQKVAYANLSNPHGLAFDPEDPTVLYFTEQNKIARVRVDTSEAPEKIIDLPSGGNHKNYSIGFGPDGRLYVALGSTCNVCYEGDERRGTIHSLNKDGSDFRKFADGLRNAPFITWSYVDGRMWVTEMGRDFLGDDLPPDEINIIEEWSSYGWPLCYGKNIHDTDFDKDSKSSPCVDDSVVPSYIDIPAHSAPLGLGFIPEEGWPEVYWHDLIVAYHGSWNRSTPTGYKLVRMKLDANGTYRGTEDFISGWLKGGTALGRPVDVKIFPGGVMYVSDDHAGVIYRVVYKN